MRLGESSVVASGLFVLLRVSCRCIRERPTAFTRVIHRIARRRGGRPSVDRSRRRVFSPRSSSSRSVAVRMTRASRASRTTRWWVSLVMMMMTLTLTTTTASETTGERDVLEDVVLTFERWVRAPASASTRGARVSDGARVVATTRGAGRGVAATRNISVGELLVDVPLEKCVSVASARDDRELWRAIEGREMSVDVILATHVLREAFGKRRRSAFWPWLRLLPRDVDSTVGWTESELDELTGSNAVTFTRAIVARWKEDFDALDAATLAERHPDVFGGEHASYFTLEKFTWARFIVWSRAIDLNLGKGGGEEDAFRVLVPFLDMANHAPSGKLHPRWDANANAVKVYAASEFRENTELRFNYGDKPSQYFLLQYGFLPERNPSDCVEATVRVDERDSLREQKERLLLRHGLDPRTRNFQWKHVGLDYDLIAATRIVMMDESEIDDDTSVALAVSGASVSAKNDARTKAVLLKSLSGFLGGYKTTLGEDNHYVARSSDESSDEPFPGKRKRFAVMLRMTEKRILLSSADAVFKEFPDEDDDLVKATCEEIFSVEVDECMKRAGGAKFSSFGKRPASKDEESRAEL